LKGKKGPGVQGYKNIRRTGFIEIAIAIGIEIGIGIENNTLK